MNIDVIVADDFPLTRRAMSEALDSDPDVHVVGEAEDGESAIELVLLHHPDVLLLDLNMPRLDGLGVLRQLHDRGADTRVLIVTASEKADVFLRAIDAGARGYVTKRAGRRELLNAVINVHGGGTVLNPRFEGYIPGTGRNGSIAAPLLTPREQQVLGLVTGGLTDGQIGAELGMSPRTVQNHLNRMREKTGLRRRSELTRWAVEHTWL